LNGTFPNFHMKG